MQILDPLNKGLSNIYKMRIGQGPLLNLLKLLKFPATLKSSSLPRGLTA
jgi:hypothetical protein